jgi:uncharacterized protein YceK
MRRTAVLVALAVLPSLTGCGTMFNMGHNRQVYGGVRLDAAAEAGLVDKGVGLILSPEPDPFSPGACFWFAGWTLLDLPLSAAADTVTLPFTILSPPKPLFDPPDPSIFGSGERNPEETVRD